MSCIFISYRREDSSGYAGRIYDRFCEHFGNDSVFMDVDTIQPGDDFVDVINQKVGSCDVFVAVIGKQWVTLPDQNGRRRLDNPNDFVRLELAAALARKIRVIPVLVGGARMPAVEDLPAPLAPLSTRNAIELTDTAFQEMLPRLIHALETSIHPVNSAPLPLANLTVEKKADPPPQKPPLWLYYGAAALALLVVGFLILRPNSDSRRTQHIQLSAPDKVAAGHRALVGATSNSGLPVMVSVKGNCTARGNNVVGGRPGPCQIVAFQDGNQTFQPASLEKVIQIVETLDNCREGFTWREATPNDHVCVTSETRRQVEIDNSQQAARVSSTDHASGPGTCVVGFVWREAVPNDRVCVTVATREQAAEDNAAARARIAR